MKKINLKFIIPILLLITIIVIFFHLHENKNKSHVNVNAHHSLNSEKKTDKKSEKEKNDSVVVTKSALDELVKKAADQKYLQDVLTSGPKLPVNGHRDKPIDLQKKPNSVVQNQTNIAPQKAENEKPQQTSSAPNNAQQQCTYNNQTYSIGEIVQVDKGWVRCTPSIVINSDGSSQYGDAVWTLRDGLL